jgi:GTP-binding protein
MKFINVAIIAHVDHGKTTLVDALLKQTNTFRENEDVGTTIMDSNDQEKERGITIYAKNTAVQYGDYKINIVDTPGHADFGSEVERVLRMVDSVCLVVDAYEGPMPQTTIRSQEGTWAWSPPNCRNQQNRQTIQHNQLRLLIWLFDLFVQLGANDEQLDFPIVYTIAREGIALLDLKDEKNRYHSLFDAVLEKVAPAKNDQTATFRMQVANLAYDNYLGRMGIGRVYEGVVKTGQNVSIIGNDGSGS